MSCFSYEGIDAVKSALMEGVKCTTEEMPIKVLYILGYCNYANQVNLIAPPHYVVTASTMERAEGIEAVTKVIETIRLAIEKLNGTFKVITAVRFSLDRISKN